ncbi:MAG: sulfatase [Chromatiales bacterium]
MKPIIRYRRLYALKLALVVLIGIIAPAPAWCKSALNVLLITIDDLRPELSVYGVDTIYTPNIDALASQGTVFTRAFAQMATCSPSRTSMMTGLRPDTTKVYNLKTHFRTTIPTVVRLPQYFKQNGYQTKGIGKVYHVGLDDPASWTLPSVTAFGNIIKPLGPDGKRLAYAAINAPVSNFSETRVANAAISALRNLQTAPFFLAVGFRKPHLPFYAPAEFFDQYDPWVIPLAENPFRAIGAPDIAFENASELRTYSEIPAPQFITETQARELKWGYYAATSFTDSQIGRVLTELKNLNLEDSTLVVLWGDHGFHLGEQLDWGKHMNFDVATRIPLIIRVPGQVEIGKQSHALVELVDLYPTITKLAGLPIPGVAEHGGYALEGDSLAQFIANPPSQSRRGAFSQWRRSGYKGHSIRTDGYRFTEWTKSGVPAIHELYDHQKDPSETMNVVSHPAYAAILVDLKTALHDGGQKDLPASLLP